MVSLTTGGIRSVIYEGTSILADLYIKVSLCCFRLSAREFHPHSLYRLSIVPDLVLGQLLFWQLHFEVGQAQWNLVGNSRPKL